MKMEKDVSVRQQAVDLLYAMCDKSNAEEIVQEMLNYLETADYSIREEMVLKVAILAEKYATDYTWYVDVILNLIRIAGDYVSEEVWYRVIQIVINRDEVQGYAAKTVFEVSRKLLSFSQMLYIWIKSRLNSLFWKDIFYLGFNTLLMYNSSPKNL